MKEFINEIWQLYKEISKYLRFILVFLLFLFSSLISVLFCKIFNIDINNIDLNTNIIFSFFSNIIILIILIILYRKKLKDDFNTIKKMKKNKLMIILDTSFRYWLIGLIIMIGSNFIINKLGISTSINDLNVRNILNNSPLLAGINVILLSPLIEEIVFRLGFKDIINKRWLFIVISGIVFGALHIISSVSSGYELLYLIPYCSLGIAFASIYDYSNNIYIVFLFHIIHNVLTALITFLLVGVILW